MKILVTGANGFLGGHLVEQAIQLGNQVFAAHRKNANIEFLRDINAETVVLDYQEQALCDALALLKEKQGAFDLVIHNAAITNTTDDSVFYKVNHGLTRNLINALKATDFLGAAGKFVLISSLAAFGPVGFDGPVSHYGKSKLSAEKEVIASGLPYMIFRPTAIYGPRDSSFIPLFKVVKLGLYPMINPPDQKITMIHGADVAFNVIHISKTHTNKIVPLDDGNVYHHSDFKRIIEGILNKKSFAFKLPFGLTRLIMRIITIFAKIFRFTPTLTAEKHFEISRNWDHDFSDERKTIPLQNRFDVMAGFEDTLNYYRRNKLI